MKMKVGDLVTLSAYGQQRVRAEWIGRNDVGVITQVIKYGSGGYSYPDDYQVYWQSTIWQSRGRWHCQRLNTRKDLKYVKNPGSSVG